jgi:glycosyltransferase involved in cell wall biosynthesis
MIQSAREEQDGSTMRILVMLSGQKWMGGLAIQTALLCREWERQGHEVAVIAVGADIALDSFRSERVRWGACPASQAGRRKSGGNVRILRAAASNGRARPGRVERAADEYVFRYEVVADVARYVFDGPPVMRKALWPVARAGVALFAPPPWIGPAREAVTGLARSMAIALDARLSGGAAEAPLLTRLLLHTDEEDLRRIEEIRDWFQPEIEYACDLTLVPLMARTRDRGIPLVAGAQGFEIVLRRGVPLIPALRAARQRVDLIISGSHENLGANVAPVAALAGDSVPARVIPYGVALDEGWEMDYGEAVGRMEAIERRLALRDRGPHGLWGPGGPPDNLFAPDAPFIVTCYSRIDVEKGTDLPLHAVAILRDQGIPARLWIAGNAVAGSAYLDVLRQKVRFLDLTDRVSLIGTLPDPLDKVALLRASSALALGFIRTEPFGMVYTEGFAAGVPVVAPATGAAPELMAYAGETATLYPKNDTGALAARLRLLYEQPERRRRLGAQERRAFLQRYNATVMAREALAAFEEAIRRRKRAGAAVQRAAA